jgi:SAM-dependent methyltransferase
MAVLVSFDTQAAFDSAYSLPGVGNYTRAAFGDFHMGRIEEAARRSGWAKNQSILIVGCGFGWAVERLIAVGYTQTWGVDSSPYIHANKAAQTSASSRIIDANILTPAGRTTIQNVSGVNRFRYLVSEDVLPCYDDAGATELHAAMGLLRHAQGEVGHVVTDLQEGVMQDPAYNWKTVEDWRLLLSTPNVYSVRELWQP